MLRHCNWLSTQLAQQQMAEVETAASACSRVLRDVGSSLAPALLTVVHSVLNALVKNNWKLISHLYRREEWGNNKGADLGKWTLGLSRTCLRLGLVVGESRQPVIKTWPDSPAAPSPTPEAGPVALPVLLALSLPVFQSPARNSAFYMMPNV